MGVVLFRGEWEVVVGFILSFWEGDILFLCCLFGFLCYVYYWIIEVLIVIRRFLKFEWDGDMRDFLFVLFFLVWGIVIGYFVVIFVVDFCFNYLFFLDLILCCVFLKVYICLIVNDMVYELWLLFVVVIMLFFFRIFLIYEIY